MADLDGPRLATPAEFEAVSRAVDRCFNFEDGGYRARWPQCFDESGSYHAVVERDGEVVSHVGCVPQTVVVGDVRLESWGVTGVGTLPAHQGNGYMSALLEFWIDRMREAGVPLSDLAGDRARYGRYGWEIAGRECFYRVTERGFDSLSSSGRVREYAGDEDVDRVREIHDREPLRVERDREQYADLLAKRGVRTLLYGGDEPAYLSFTLESTDRTVTEFGGSRAGVEALLEHALAAYRTNSLTVRARPDERLAPLFRAVADRWRVEPHRSFNVVDLRALLDAYAPRLAAAWRERGDGGEGRVSFGIAGESAVELAYGPDGVAVEEYGGRPDVELDRADATRLLFGAPGGLAVGADDPFLSAVLPLSLYVWRTDQV